MQSFKQRATQSKDPVNYGPLYRPAASRAIDGSWVNYPSQSVRESRRVFESLSRARRDTTVDETDNVAQKQWDRPWQNLASFCLIFVCARSE